MCYTGPYVTGGHAPALPSSLHTLPCLQLRDELGSLRLKVQVHEQRILPNRYYDHFTDFMVKAVQAPRLAVSCLLSQPLWQCLFVLCAPLDSCSYVRSTGVHVYAVCACSLVEC